MHNQTPWLSGSRLCNTSETIYILSSLHALYFYVKARKTAVRNANNKVPATKIITKVYRLRILLLLTDYHQFFIALPGSYTFNSVWLLILVIFHTIQGLPNFVQIFEPGIQPYQDLPQTGNAAAGINNVPILVFFAV